MAEECKECTQMRIHFYRLLLEIARADPSRLVAEAAQEAQSFLEGE